MHIPNGSLCPLTCISFYALMTPFWILAAKKANNSLKSRFIPVVAAGMLFTFAVMMFDMKIPGGATGHAIGAAALSILFGPWVGVLSTSITLAVQAFIFNDGGTFTLGANCFSVAVIPSFTAYFLYNRIKSDNLVKKVAVAGISGYFSLVFAALAVGILLGLEPNPLRISSTSMLYQHLLAFGWLEAILTASVTAAFMYARSPLASLVSIKEKSETNN